MSDARKLAELGMSPVLAKEVAAQIAAAAGTPYTDADAVAAVAAKTEVAALDAQSTAADIVAALQA